MFLSLQIKLSIQANDSKDRREILLFSLIFSDIIFLDLSLTDQKNPDFLANFSNF